MGRESAGKKAIVLGFFLKGLQEIRRTKKNIRMCSYIKSLSLKNGTQSVQKPYFVDKPVKGPVRKPIFSVYKEEELWLSAPYLPTSR